MINNNFSEKINNEIAEFTSVFDTIADKRYLEQYKNIFSDNKKLGRAILDLTYKNKRYVNNRNYFNAIYSDMYPVESLRDRRFVAFGPGSFHHQYWRSADKIFLDGKRWADFHPGSKDPNIDYNWDLFSHQPLQEEENFFEAAYASHVIEHGYNDDIDFFFKDVFRILKQGGIFRITAPNIDLALDAAKGGDYSYFGQHLFYKEPSQSEKVFGPKEHRTPIEYFVLSQASLLTNVKNGLYIPEKECSEFLWQDTNIYTTLNFSSVKSDRALANATGLHVNWFNPEKAIAMLRDAGFNSVRLSGYAQSICPVMRDKNLFDNNAPSMSFFIDAIK